MPYLYIYINIRRVRSYKNAAELWIKVVVVALC